MLPFTKRPGRGDDDGGDVFTKDDLPTSQVKPNSVRPPAKSEPDEDELTHLMPTKSLRDPSQPPKPLPAAGRPATVPPPRSSSRPASIPPPARASVRPPQMEEEDDEGRTVVRGAPKIVKRGAPKSTRPPAMNSMGGETSPTTLSPAAVIKQTLESTRASNRPQTSELLMPGPPRDLLEDHADVHPADAGPQRTVSMPSAPPAPPSQPPPGLAYGATLAAPGMMPMMGAPASVRPPPQSYPAPPRSQPPQSMGYGSNPYSQPIPSGSVSVPGVAPPSMPAHFMNSSYSSSAHVVDPPGTSVTQRNRVAGRPAMSWAAALLAFGLFVGVGAVAVMQSNGGLADTSASFVDPSRAPGARPAAPPAAPAPSPVAADTATVAPAATTPPVVTPPVTPPPAAANPYAAPAAQPGGLIGVGTPSPAAAPPETKPADAKPADTKTADAKPADTKKTAPRTYYRPSAAPPPKPASEESAPAPVAAAEPKKPPPAAPTKKGGKGDDDEMKKALEQLQKSQLESTF